MNGDIIAPVVCELDGVGLTSVIMLEPVADVTDARNRRSALVVTPVLFPSTPEGYRRSTSLIAPIGPGLDPMLGAQCLSPEELFEPSVHLVVRGIVRVDQFVPLRGAPVDE